MAELRRALGTAATVVALGLSACAPAPVPRTTVGAAPSESVPPASTTQAKPTESTTQEPSPEPPTACLAKAESLTAEQQAGQLLMVGVSTSGLDGPTADAIRRSRAGSVVLLGSGLTSRDRAAEISAAIGVLGSVELPMLVAVDQEGGQVQRLRGEGFTRIPSAVEQGELEAADLREQAREWGEELRWAGVRFNLAPTADVVPEQKVSTNAPIGRLQRHYGTDPERAAESVRAFVEGMDAAGVATSLKHFPGLGEVTENTDFAPALDTDTVLDDDAWATFLAGIEAGASSVMVSSAVFEQLDPGVEAVFSEPIITGILREHLGFDGVVIADDLGAAKAVADVPPGDRAVLFLRAGGDLVIDADPALAVEMTGAIVEEMETDEGFADDVAASVARVLELKESVGLGSCD